MSNIYKTNGNLTLVTLLQIAIEKHQKLTLHYELIWITKSSLNYKNFLSKNIN